MSGRANITPRTRFLILHRDRYRCRYCGASSHETRLEIDHYIPVAIGGSNEMSNLVTACELCNAGKSALNPLTTTIPDHDDPLGAPTGNEPRAVREFRSAISMYPHILAAMENDEDAAFCELIDYFDTIVVEAAIEHCRRRGVAGEVLNERGAA